MTQELAERIALSLVEDNGFAHFMWQSIETPSLAPNARAYAIARAVEIIMEEASK